MTTPSDPQALSPGRILLILVALGTMFGLSYFRLAREPEQEQPELIAIYGETMGTTYIIKIVKEPDHRIWRSEIILISRVLLSALDKKMSTYDDTSELSLFNAWDSTEPFELSLDTAQVFAAALTVSDQSAGAFDVTVGPIVNAYGFGPEARTSGPTDDELSALRERVGYEKLSLDIEKRTLSKSQPDLYCDLSAIAKGYAVDQIVRTIERRGFIHYMVEIGGEVRARGQNDRRETWRIGIEEPIEDERRIYRTIPLKDLAMATSGDYRNSYILNGTRVSHTIDGRTGRPITHALASATVFHEQCMMADAYATTMMVLGPDEGYALAKTLNLPVLFLIRNDDGSLTERTSPAFDERFGSEK